MKTIELATGELVKVDDEDYPYLSKFKWHRKLSHGNVYAQRHFLKSEGKGKGLIKMHREIMSVSDPKIMVDHEDQDGLNNQRYNLRTCDNSSNKKNGRSHSDSTSKYVGVSWNKAYSKWTARILVGKKYKFLGNFSSEIDAAQKRDEAAKLYHGEFASLNFKDEKN